MAYVIAIVVILLLAGAYYLQRGRRIICDEVRGSVNQRASKLQSQIGHFRKRFMIVQSDATDYANSLGADGSKMLYDLNLRISAIETLVEEIKTLVELNDAASFYEAEQLLEGRHATQGDDVPPSKRRFCLPFAWEEKLEDELQLLGKRVLEASIDAGVSGLPKRPKNKRTLLNMIEAGIKLDSPQ